MSKLEKETAFQFAMENLNSQFPGLRNLIITLLARTPRPEVLKKAREIYKQGRSEMRISMLKLFHKIGGWKTIPDLMIGTIDENEKIREIALGYLHIWIRRATRLFTSPQPEEIERAKRIFQLAYETHQSKQYFKTNPLKGLDFYLK